MKNPVERIMSVINLGLWCVRMMCQEGSSEFEKVIKTASSLKALRKAIEVTNKDDVKASLSLPINLLTPITKHLELKGKSFSVFESARDNEITAFWEVLNITYIFFSDQKIGTNDHYISFAKNYSTKATEDDCASQAKKKKNKVNYLFA